MKIKYSSWCMMGTCTSHGPVATRCIGSEQRRRVASVRAAWSLGLHCPMLTPSRHERRREREEETLPTFSTLHAVSWSATTAQTTWQHPVIIIIIIITASLQSTSDSEIFSSWFLCCSLQRHWRHQGVEGVTFHLYSTYAHKGQGCG